MNETYISDIVGRNNVRNKSELEELLNILSSAIGSLTSVLVMGLFDFLLNEDSLDK